MRRKRWNAGPVGRHGTKSMRPVWTFAAIPLALLVGCQGEAAKPRGVNLIYDEFFKAITKRYGADGTTGNLVAYHAGDLDLGTLVIRCKTATYSRDVEREEPDRWDTFRRRLPSLRRDTYNEYWVRNEVRHELTLKKAGGWRLRLLGEDEYAEVEAAGKRDGSGFWNTFYVRFPDSQRVSISAPGISPDGKQVLLYFCSAFGSMAASGTYYLMEKRGDSWEITDAAVVWVQ